MALPPGTRLGPYEILSPLGAGGMGEVYRAKDSRLARDVAVKVLPEDFLEGEERKARFEREARLLAALNHPNIAAIYSFEEIPRSPGFPARHLLVMELLEGESLRSALDGGKLSPRTAIAYALQIAHALAAAHEKGIVHRDLKPENLFVTKAGRIKILDFGLAKSVRTEKEPDFTDLPTAKRISEPNVVMGTPGYVSPEQLRGQQADPRSDIFALGAVLYEMVSGTRAFRGGSAADTVSAILTADPPDLSVTDREISPGFARIVRQCLEKTPEQRFHSAHDLALALECVNTSFTSPPRVPPSPESRPWSAALPAAALVLGALLGGAFVAWRRPSSPSSPSFQPMTYRRGTVFSARFAPDGQTVVYAAAWDGRPTEIYSQRPGSPEARALGLAGTGLFAVSRSGEMALSLSNQRVNSFLSSGTLADAPLSGGEPRPTLENVLFADWAPDGTGAAVVRTVEGRSRLEFPVGKVLYETAGWISHPRFSPAGDRIAFLEHPQQGNDLGWVALVDLEGHRTKLGPEWGSVEGLAWSPRGNEVWFASSAALLRDLRAVDLSGRVRLLARAPGGLTLLDVSPSGRALIIREDYRASLLASPAGSGSERDLSWLDTSVVADISADGQTLLIGELGEAGGALGAAYVRRVDGSPALRLGDGSPTSLSPDGMRALTILHGAPSRLVLLPTGPGQMVELSRGPIVEYHWAVFFAGGALILFAGNEAGHGARLYVQSLAGGDPRAISPEGIAVLHGGLAISPDGKRAAAVGPDGRIRLYPVDRSEEGDLIPDLPAGFWPIRWSRDGSSLYVFRRSELPVRISRVTLADGRLELWKSLLPPDPAGVTVIGPVVIAADEKTYAYMSARALSQLYLADGLR